MMIAIIDYGVGNLFSLQSTLTYLGIDAVVTKDPQVIDKAEKLILPGVGAFADAIGKLREGGLDALLVAQAKKGKPLLGICLGMQMLFEKSFEYGERTGLGLIQGAVQDITPLIGEDCKVPHMGWNGLVFPKNREKSVLYKEVVEGECIYFVHSYAAVECENNISAQTEYGGMLTASVERGNVYGVQFHPEKSGEVGLRILKAFCEMGCED